MVYQGLSKRVQDIKGASMHIGTDLNTLRLSGWRTLWHCYKKGSRIAKVLIHEALFNPYFYVPKYLSSDALPAPEISFVC